MKPMLIALCITLAIAAGGCVSIDTESAVESFERVLPLDAGGTVNISNINGAVRVATWDRQEVRIGVEKKARGSSPERAQETLQSIQIDIAGGGGQVTIETRKSPGGHRWLGGWLGGRGAVQVQYTITVPARAEVVAKTVNGPVEVKDLVGRVDAGTVNGGIDISGVVGSVDAETINGGIDVALTALTGDRGMKLQTVNGGITLSLPADSKATVDAGVTNGGIRCDLPLSHEDKSRRHLRGDLGGGGVAIDLDTTNGGIDIVGR